jgi:hypothetical protein
MTLHRRHSRERASREYSRVFGYSRSFFVALGLLLVLTRIPLASAHGGTATAGLSQWHGIALSIVGFVFLGGTILLKQTNRISPTVALYGVFVGIVVTAFGAILFEGLSPEQTYTAHSMPFPRSWYQPLSLVGGLLIMVIRFVIGWLRWPTRSRYTYLGILMGVWIAYPYLILGAAGDSHLLGYAVVVGTPVLVGYIIWKDAGSVLRAVLRDSVARRFGIGVGGVVAVFFVSVTGYLSVFPEEGVSHEPFVTVLPAVYQLVTWPILEIYLPHIPLFIALSPGLLIVVGVMSTLIGLNATLIARRWRVEQQAGLTESTAGTTAVVGSCTCGCCGPLVAKVALVAAGPSIAAPLYWVFVDSASPLSTLFIVGSIILFTGSLIYSVDEARQLGQPASIVPAD